MAVVAAPGIPYLRLSGFYLFYFASLGAFLPYWGLYLKDRGFASAQIGELMAVVMAMKVVAPNLWGWLADHSGQRLPIVRVTAMAAATVFATITLDPGFWWLALSLAGFSFFWNGALPQFEALTMNHLGEAGLHRYSRIRLWGSVGFILSVAGLAPALDAYGALWLPYLVTALLLAMAINTLTVPASPHASHGAGQYSLGATLMQPPVLGLLAACFLMQASHGPYYAFFTIYLEGYGYSRTLIGQLWALGVAAEIGVFLLMHRWLPRYGARRLLLTAIGVTAARWVIIGTMPMSLVALLLAQGMHAASFGLYHAAAIHLVHRLFRGPLQGRGQALYSSLSFGLGGAVGSLASGYLWEALGGGGTYILGALAAALALMVAWAGLRRLDEGQAQL